MGKYSISLIYLFLFFLHEMKQISQCNKAAFYWIKLFHHPSVISTKCSQKIQ